MEPAKSDGAAQPATLLELTSLRFIAAFAVLVLHYRDLLGPMPDWLMRGIVGGQYGVTFFFILSGFILTHRYQGWFAGGVSESRYGWFLRFRLARIYPVYLLGLLLDTPWHLVERAQAAQLDSVGATWWASWLINLVGLQAWVPAVPFAMFWNTPAWSVSAEFFFYATFPFVCGAIARHLRTPLRLGAAFMATVLGGVALYAVVLDAMNGAPPLGAQAQYIVLVYNPVLRYSEFLAGCLAGQYFLLARQAAVPGDPGRRARDLVVLLALAAVAARVFLPDYTGALRWRWLLDVSMKYAAFIVPFTAIVLAVASGRTWLSALLRLRWMVLLGEASYALYIIHCPCLTLRPGRRRRPRICRKTPPASRGAQSQTARASPAPRRPGPATCTPGVLSTS